MATQRPTRSSALVVLPAIIERKIFLMRKEKGILSNCLAELYTDSMAGKFR